MPHYEQIFEIPLPARPQRRTQHYLSFAAWVQVTHKTKNAVKAAIPNSTLQELGCDNPDIGVIGHNDDRIVVYPSKSARQSKKYRKSKVITDIRAANVLGSDWRNKIPVMKLIDQHVWLENIVNRCSPNDHLSVVTTWERGSIFKVIYQPSEAGADPVLRIELV